MKPQLISIGQLCTQLGIGRTKAYELLADKKISSMKIGSRKLVVYKSVIDFVEQTIIEGDR